MQLDLSPVKKSDLILILAVNSHAELFSSAAYLCLLQESMLVDALSRLLETVAKSILFYLQS